MTPRFLSTLLLIGMLAPVAASAAAPAPELALNIDSERAGADPLFEAFDTDKMNVWDFNGDGVLEIVSQNDNNHLYVIDARSGRALAQIHLEMPRNFSYRQVGGVAIGDVDDDGRVDLVSANIVGRIVRYEFVPEESYPDAYVFDIVWDVHYEAEDLGKTPPYGSEPGYDSAPVLADVTGDGRLEIFVMADNTAGHYSLDADGNLRWGTLNDDGDTNPWVADLDRDGRYEAVFASDAGRIWTYDADSGDLLWNFNTRDHGADPGSISIAPMIADVTGDGNLEIAFGARQAVDDGSENWIENQHAKFFTLDARGNLLWGKDFPWGNPHISMHPVPQDVTGDGVDEILFLDWNTIGHKPGNWESTGPANLFAVEGATGDLVWHTEVDTFYSNKDLVVADVDGDGAREILVHEGRGTQDGLGVYDLAGGREAWWPIGDWKASNDAIAADLCGDGRTQLVIPVSKRDESLAYRDIDVGYRKGALKIFDLGDGVEVAWDGVFLFNPHLGHLYGGESEGIPRGDLDVTALVSKPFRVELDGASPNATVEARVEGGAWTPLEPTGDGAWTGPLSPASLDELDLVVRSADGLRFADPVSDGFCAPEGTRAAFMGPEAGGEGENGRERQGGPASTPAPGPALALAAGIAATVLGRRGRRRRPERP